MSVGVIDPTIRHGGDAICAKCGKIYDRAGRFDWWFNPGAFRPYTELEAAVERIETELASQVLEPVHA